MCLHSIRRERHCQFTLKYLGVTPGTRNLFGEEGSSVEISPSVRYRPFSDIIYMLPIPHTLFVFCVCTLSVRPAARFVELKNTARQKVQNSAFLVSDRCTDRTFRLSFRQTPCLPTRSTFVSRRKRVSPASIQIDNASQSATFYVN
jgi:hypothetical protein